MMMGKKEERERERERKKERKIENMVGERNDRRHRRGLSPTMAPPTMEPWATVRGGHGLERKKEKK